ncbi:MAG: hypothetical protein J6R08_07190, partial [Opitutales bacterium]|nr:hypothetical protein [Opitutales bacterium]
MKKLISASIFASAAFMALGADYYLTSGENVDILDLSNWGAEEITTADTLNIQNDGTSAVLNGTGKSFSFNHMHIRGNVSLDILGSGNKLTGEGTSNSTVYLGSNANNSSVLNILGYGNSFSDKSGWSFMMGNTNSTEGENLLRIHSSRQNEVDAEGNVLVDNSNRFIIPSSVNSFVYNSQKENSTAKNTISIGDNSILDFQTNFVVGANSGEEAIKGGTSEVVFDGSNSSMTIKQTSVIGSNSGGQAGGTARIVMGGSSNKILASNNVFVGAGQNYAEGVKHTGGTNGIYITGSGNEFTSEESISVASAFDMSGGVNEFVVSGNNNVVNMKNINVSRNNATAKFSGGTNQFLVSGSGNVITAANSINVYTEKQTGGNALFEVSGKNNEVYFSSNNTIGNAMSGGTARWVLGGENNSASYVNVMSFQLGRTAMTGGEATLEIRGKNNTANFFNVFMGNADTVDGKVKFIVEGSGHSIKINSNLATYFSGEVDDNGKAVGGGFSFIADSGGFSTIEINNFSTLFNGLIEIDFSNYVVNDTDNGDEFTLMSVNNSAGNLLSEIQIDLEKYFSVSGSDDYELLFGDKTLGVRVFSTNVPEPATYAAIFGALALAFAA